MRSLTDFVYRVFVHICVTASIGHLALYVQRSFFDSSALAHTVILRYLATMGGLAVLLGLFT